MNVSISTIKKLLGVSPVPGNQGLYLTNRKAQTLMGKNGTGRDHT